MARPGHFGHRIIGEEQFEEEKEVVKSQRLKYGPRVLGELEDAPEAEEAEETASPEGETPDDGPVVETVDVDFAMNLSELDELLEENPHYAAHALKHEIQREDGVRKGALQSIIDAAMDAEDEATFGIAQSELAALEDE